MKHNISNGGKGAGGKIKDAIALLGARITHKNTGSSPRSEFVPTWNDRGITKTPKNPKM